MLLLFLSLLDNPNDSDLFESIYKEYNKVMMYVADGVLNNIHDSEDAVQNAFIAAAKNFSTIKDMEPDVMKAYLCRSARNHAINMLVKRNRIDSHEEPLTDDNNINLSYDDFSDNIAKTENFATIVKCIRALPDTYRDTLYLFYVEDLTDTQISEKLNLKKATVKRRLVRGKKMLLQLLGKEGICNK